MVTLILSVWLGFATVILMLALLAVLPGNLDRWISTLLISVVFALTWPILIGIFIIGFFISAVFLSKIIRE